MSREENHSELERIATDAHSRFLTYQSACRNNSNPFCQILPTGAALVIAAVSTTIATNARTGRNSDATMDALMRFARWLNCVGNCLFYANVSWILSRGTATAYHQWAEEFCDPLRRAVTPPATPPPPPSPPLPPTGPITPRDESEEATPTTPSTAGGEPGGAPPQGGGGAPGQASPGSGQQQPPGGGQQPPTGGGQQPPAGGGQPPAGGGQQPPPGGGQPPGSPPPPMPGPAGGGGGQWRANPAFADLDTYPADSETFDRDLSGLTTPLTQPMIEAAEDLLRQRSEAASDASFGASLVTLCCKAMAWAEQVTVNACMENVCGPLDAGGTGFDVGALVAVASHMRGQGYPMPSLGEGLRPFADLVTDASRMGDWQRRFDFGADLCD